MTVRNETPVYILHDQNNQFTVKKIIIIIMMMMKHEQRE